MESGMVEKGDKVTSEMGRERSPFAWGNWMRGHATRVALACAAMGLALYGAVPAMAMGIPPVSGGMVMLEPNTITVTGMATEPMTNSVNDISYNMNISDLTYGQIAHEAAKRVAAITHAIGRLGIPAGDIVVGSSSLNGGNNNPTENLQLNIIVAKSSQVSAVLAAVTENTPNQVQNSYANVQVLPLNPAVLWPSLYAAAIANARAQATFLAKQAGKSLGAILSISTVSQQGYIQSLSGPYQNSPSIVGMQMAQQSNGTTSPTVTTQLFVSFAMMPAK